MSVVGCGAGVLCQRAAAKESMVPCQVLRYPSRRGPPTRSSTFNAALISAAGSPDPHKRWCPSRRAAPRCGSASNRRRQHPAADPRVMVVAEQIGGGIDHVPGHGQTLDGVTRVSEVVQGVRQTIASCIDGLRFQRRRTITKICFGQGASAPGLAIGIDQNETGGIHVLKDRPPCGDVRSKELQETGTGVDEEFNDTFLEPDRFPAGHAAVVDEHRDVQITAGSGESGSRGACEDHGERIGKAAADETSRLVGGVCMHEGQSARILDQRRVGSARRGSSDSMPKRRTVHQRITEAGRPPGARVHCGRPGRAGVGADPARFAGPGPVPGPRGGRRAAVALRPGPRWRTGRLGHRRGPAVVRGVAVTGRRPRPRRPSPGRPVAGPLRRVRRPATGRPGTAEPPVQGAARSWSSCLPTML